jgi:hypothetical protein
MPLYAVRLIADKSAIGLIYAETLTELCLTLDERLQSNWCEYREIIAPAAIFFDGENDARAPWKLGIKDGPLANVPEVFAAAAIDAIELASKERIAIIGQSMNFDLEQNTDLHDTMMGNTDTTGWHLAELDPLEPIREVLESDESDVIH